LEIKQAINKINHLLDNIYCHYYCATTIVPLLSSSGEKNTTHNFGFSHKNQDFRDKSQR